MSANSKIAEILISQLGAPKEPGYEWIAAATFILLIGGYIALEQGGAEFLRRLFRRSRTNDEPSLPPD